MRTLYSGSFHKLKFKVNPTTGISRKFTAFSLFLSIIGASEKLAQSFSWMLLKRGMGNGKWEMGNGKLIILVLNYSLLK